MALPDPDPRTRRGCAWPLSELGAAIRQDLKAAAEGNPPNGASGNGQPQLSKSLEALPSDGALRFLCEAATRGMWPVLSDDDDESIPHGLNNVLTAQQAASVLRCLSSAPRLPALDWTSACRQLMRSHPGCSVLQEACVAFAAAHASMTPSYKLHDFVGSELLAKANFASLCLSARCAVLRSLPQFLAAIPDDEGRAVLGVLCDACPDVGHTSAVELQQGGLELQVALLEGLSGVAGCGSALAELAQRLAVKVVLPRLLKPRDQILSLSNHARALKATNRQHEAGKTRSALLGVLQCAAAMPFDVLTAVCTNASLFNTSPVHYAWLIAALVAAGKLHLRALQLPRNAVLNGLLSKTAEDEEAVVLYVASALTLAPSVAPLVQQHWILDVLQGAEKCEHPTGAVKLAVCGVVGMACAADVAAGMTGSAHWCMVSCRHVLNALPVSMERLCKGDSAPAGVLCATVETLGAAGEELCGVSVPALQQWCCLALRHGVPWTLWRDVAEKIL